MFERSRSSQDRRKLDTLFDRAKEQNMEPKEVEKRAYDLGMKQLEFEGLADTIKDKITTYRVGYTEKKWEKLKDDIVKGPT